MSESELKILPQKKTISPVGIAQYAYLTKPDHGKGSWYDEVGNYKTDLVVSKSEAEAFINKYKELLQAQVDEIKPKLKGAQKAKFKVRDLFEEGCAIVPEYDDEGDVTENVVIKFKSKASFTNKAGEFISNKPRVVDCTPKSEGGPNVITSTVYGGSKIRIACAMKPYYHTNTVGVKLQFSGVQVIEMADFQSSNQDDFGDFDGGFTAAPSAPVDSPSGDTPEETEDF